jgi:hypothetical protein
MVTMEVQPRPTPEERSDVEVSVEVDERLSEFAADIEDWIARQDTWEFVLREGTEFGRANNVEGDVVHASGEASSSLLFRLDQLSTITQLGDAELTLIFEERDGIAKAARLTETGIAVELFHVLTFT